MAKCQNLTTNFFFRQNRLFSLYFRELSDLEQKKKKNFFLIFLNFFTFFHIFGPQKGPKSRFSDFSRTCSLLQRLEDPTTLLGPKNRFLFF